MREKVKAVCDVLAAAAALVVLAPAMLLIALLVRIKLGSPVIFAQERPGKNGKPFTMYKFRTMRSGEGSDAERMTRFGSVLRSTSLDELPELLNVLKGEMSLVGPRPLLMKYLELYSTEQARRHEVRPGITGWAQVNGRNAISWEEKFALDVWYVDHQSFWLDFKILWMTIVSVVRRSGVQSEGHPTTPEFIGSQGTPSAS